MNLLIVISPIHPITKSLASAFIEIFSLNTASVAGFNDMITTNQLIDKFLDSAQSHQPTMNHQQIKVFVLGILADELRWAFNNYSMVANNVRKRLQELVPREVARFKINSNGDKTRITERA